MPDWPRALGVYLGTIALGALGWEAAHRHPMLALHFARRAAKGSLTSDR